MKSFDFDCFLLYRRYRNAVGYVLCLRSEKISLFLSKNNKTSSQYNMDCSTLLNNWIIFYYIKLDQARSSFLSFIYDYERSSWITVYNHSYARKIWWLCWDAADIALASWLRAEEQLLVASCFRHALNFLQFRALFLNVEWRLWTTRFSTEI